MTAHKEYSGNLVPHECAPRPIDGGVDIGHVHMKTADLGPVYDFYVGILGFDVIVRLPDALFLSAGGYHHDLAFNTWTSGGGSPPPPGTTGLYHIAIRYPTRAALGDALVRLADAGWPLSGVNDHGTHEALYLQDPDDNGLELYWDRPEEEWPLDADGHLGFESGARDLNRMVRELLELGREAHPAGIMSPAAESESV
jgi:catechol 2,3-dioxygenase